MRGNNRRTLALLGAIRAWPVLGLLAAISCRPAADMPQADEEDQLAGPRTQVVRELREGGDPSILAILNRAILIDSAAAAITASRTGNPELRALARQVLSDSRALRVEAERVARRLRITPEQVAPEVDVFERDTVLVLLQGMPRGPDFDKAYMDHHLSSRLDILEVAVRGMEVARAAEVRAYIQNLAPRVRDQLDRAQTVQAGLR